jgi:hypothetical protein
LRPECKRNVSWCKTKLNTCFKGDSSENTNAKREQQYFLNGPVGESDAKNLVPRNFVGCDLERVRGLDLTAATRQTVHGKRSDSKTKNGGSARAHTRTSNRFP